VCIDQRRSAASQALLPLPTRWRAGRIPHTMYPWYSCLQYGVPYAHAAGYAPWKGDHKISVAV